MNSDTAFKVDKDIKYDNYHVPLITEFRWEKFSHNFSEIVQFPIHRHDSLDLLKRLTGPASKKVEIFSRNNFEIKKFVLCICFLLCVLL